MRDEPRLTQHAHEDTCNLLVAKSNHTKARAIPGVAMGTWQLS
jgi:hypothetical protein